MIARRTFSSKCLYLGMGAMGYHISGTLSKNFEVLVWNRTTSKAQQNAKEYGTTALEGSNPFDHDLSDVDVILSCLSTSREIQLMAERLQSSQFSFKKGLIWLDNTSGVPAISQQLADDLLNRNIYFMDTPISGGIKGARAGSLTIMISGPQHAYEQALPILQTMGTNITYLGPQVGHAHSVKGLNNLLFASNLLMAMKVGQALEYNGIDVDKGLSAMITSSGGSNAMKRVHEYMTNNRSLDYRFVANGLVKDIEIGKSLLNSRFDGDPSCEMFTNILNIFRQMALEKDWENADVFDVFPYIEQ